MTEQDRSNWLLVDEWRDTSGIWLPNKSGDGWSPTAYYESFGLPDWLVYKFDFWRHWYEGYYSKENKVEIDWDFFIQYKISLAFDLKITRGNQSRIFYTVGDDDDIAEVTLPFDGTHLHWQR